MSKILVTGCAGFIGMHACKRFLKNGDIVCGVDNLNNYYDVKLKKDRLKILKTFQHFKFFKFKIENQNKLYDLFKKEKFDIAVNLAAQAGVRFSIQNPNEYIESNISGFMNILENCRKFKIKHLVYASTSSVYGLNSKQPFVEHHSTDHPVSLYAATKKANEQMAHAYSHLFGLRVTGLRFFTVYGPWGRPDMALFKFTKAILNNRKINVFNHGEMYRDFTYIDDISEGIFRISKKLPKKNITFNSYKPRSDISSAPFSIYNIGNNKSVKLNDCIKILENSLGKKSRRNNLPMQLGDVYSTKASVKKLFNDTGFMPKTKLKKGIENFVEWYLKYYY